MRARRFVAAIALAAIGLAPMLSHADVTPTDVAGIPSEQVGHHGPVGDHLVDLELVGHAPMPVTFEGPDGPETLPIGNNGAPALIGDCAFVGRWHDYSAAWGVQALDISDPSEPVHVGSITEGIPAGAVAREIRAIDLDGFKVLVVLLFARYIDSGAIEPGLNAMAFYSVDDTDCSATLLSRYDTYAFRGHEFFLWLDPDPSHDVDGHPRILVYMTAPIGPPNVFVLDASDPTAPALIGLYEAGIPVASPREALGITGDVASPAGLGSYAHSIALSDDGRTAYLSYWDGGYFTVDTSDFADAAPAPVFKPLGGASAPFVYPPDERGNTHSAVPIPGSNTAVVGDEIYVSTDGCPFGWLRTIDLGDQTTAPSQIGEYRLAENDPANCAGKLSASRNAAGLPIDGTFTMHNQTVIQDHVFTSWYGAGLRVIDVSDPTEPVEVGAFVPQPVEATATIPATSAPTHGETVDQADDWWVATWSYPVMRDGLIYVTDVRSGLYILRPDADAPFASDVETVSFREGNSNLHLFR